MWGRNLIYSFSIWAVIVPFIENPFFCPTWSAVLFLSHSITPQICVLLLIYSIDQFVYPATQLITMLFIGQISYCLFHQYLEYCWPFDFSYTFYNQLVNFHLKSPQRILIGIALVNLDQLRLDNLYRNFLSMNMGYLFIFKDIL